MLEFTRSTLPSPESYQDTEVLVIESDETRTRLFSDGRAWSETTTSADLALSTGAEGIGFIGDETGEVATTAANLFNIRTYKGLKASFGLSGDVGEDATTKIAAALACGRAIEVEEGTFKATSVLTATHPLQLHGRGPASMIVGAGSGGAHALVIDGTGVANGMTGVTVKDVQIASQGSAGDALRLINIYRSQFENVRVPSAVGAAVRLLGSCHNQLLGVTVTTNETYSAGTRALATFGISFEDNPATGVASGHNTAYDPRVEGMTGATAYRMAGSAAHNTLHGGDGVAVANGLLISAGAALNKVFDTVFEDNTVIDVSVAGYSNEFHHMQAFSIASGGAAGKVLFQSGAYDNKLLGGRVRIVEVASGAIATIIGGGLATYLANFADSGTATQVGDVYDITSGKMFSQVISVPSVDAAAGGMLSIKDSANKARRLSLGFDNTEFSNGAGYVQATVDGVANVPLQLNPSGGGVMVGLVSADPGSSNGLAMPPSTTPSMNHTGITLFHTDGLTPKFMDKNGVVRSITFT